MYQFSYADVLSDDAQLARDEERQAFDIVLSRLNTARQKGPSSGEAVEALHLLDRFWKVLGEDITHPDNGLPQPLKLSLLHIGVWNLREIEGLRLGRVHSFDALIDINAMIRDGLKSAS